VITPAIMAAGIAATVAARWRQIISDNTVAGTVREVWPESLATNEPPPFAFARPHSPVKPVGAIAQPLTQGYVVWLARSGLS
jgi:hypothetical protein